MAVENQEVVGQYHFSVEEKNSMAHQLAQKEVELKNLHDELDTIKGGFKQRIAAIQDAIAKLAENVTNGYEFRTFKCEVHYDRRRKMVEYKDPATEKIVQSRPFTPEEMQIQFHMAED